MAGPTYIWSAIVQVVLLKEYKVSGLNITIHIALILRVEQAAHISQIKGQLQIIHEFGEANGFCLVTQQKDVDFFWTTL